jgi:hypothetical protein
LAPRFNISAYKSSIRKMNAAEFTRSKYEWKQKLMKSKANSDRALCIIEMIERLEIRRHQHLEDAQGWLLHVTQLRLRAIHKADICRRAIVRLTNYFNNLVNEIQL